MSSSGLGVHVELGACRIVLDDKGKFTTYTLNFRIGEETHSFTSRYNKLLKFHESLLKNDEFQKSFNYNPPEFPSKSWFTDFTKPKNYKKRANKILKYFRILTSRPSILRNEQFQQGIDLSPHLQKSMSQIAKGLQSRKYIDKHYNKSSHHSPRSKSSTPPISNKLSKAQKVNKRITAQQQQSMQTPASMQTSGDETVYADADMVSASTRHHQKYATDDGVMLTAGNAAAADVYKQRRRQQQSTHTSSSSLSQEQYALDESQLEALLNSLAMETDKLLVDVLDGEDSKHQAQVFVEDVTDEMNDTKQMLRKLRLFDASDVLPSYLIMQTRTDCADADNMPSSSPADIMKLMQMMSKKELDEIDDIALDIRDAIINACEIAI